MVRVRVRVRVLVSVRVRVRVERLGFDFSVAINHGQLALHHVIS